MSIDHAGPFQVLTEEAHEDSAELLFLPDATAADWATIFSFAEVREVGAGLALVQAGEIDRALYLLIDGTLAVRIPREETAFKTIEAPSVVGELAFFDGSPRSATLDARDRRAGRADRRRRLPAGCRRPSRRSPSRCCWTSRASWPCGCAWPAT